MKGGPHNIAPDDEAGLNVVKMELYRAWRAERIAKGVQFLFDARGAGELAHRLRLIEKKYGEKFRGDVLKAFQDKHGRKRR